MSGWRHPARLAVICWTALAVTAHAEQAQPPRLGQSLPLVGLQRLELQSPGQPRVRLQRAEQGWVLPDKAGYPAATALLQPLQEGLERAPALQFVAAQDAPEDLRLHLYAADGRQHRLLLGEAPPGVGRLLRREGDEQVWLLDPDVALPVGELHWLERRLVNIPADEIRELDLLRANGERLVLFRPGDAAQPWHLEQLPPGRQLDAGAVDELLARFADLRFADVAPLDQLAIHQPPMLRFSLRTYAGARLRGKVYRQGAFYWVTLEASANMPVERVTGRAGWLYRLEAEQYRALARRMPQLLVENFAARR